MSRASQTLAALGLVVATGTFALFHPWRAEKAEAATFPARVQAVADEFRFSLSRSQVPAGRVTIELVNFGEDPHNFKIKRIGGTRVHTVGETLPGARTTKTFKLRQGRFKYWCSVADHKALGMKGRLRVSRP
ncbi:MAG TPA: plastocyanin/azurin family copper-binding protein [Gaiellaceae bacterium]|nr:plastocyanin/azurin family copper-binding protein [Gaiellaceae bacterium]